MNKTFGLFVVLMGVLVLSLASMAIAANSLEGTWAFTDLGVSNEGKYWYSDVGRVIFNGDGTGTMTKSSNGGGVLTSKTESFTYAISNNSDGSITLSITYPDRSSSTRIVLSDDGKMLISDGTVYPNDQMIFIGIKLDTSKTYSNADLSGDYYNIGYENNGDSRYVPPPKGNGHNMAISSIVMFDGSGHYAYYGEANSDGTIYNSGESNDWHRTYSVGQDGSLSIQGVATGYLNGDGKIGSFSTPTITDSWVFYIGMKKADKIYSAEDLSGTWGLAGFGDDNRTSFNAVFGSMTCNRAGNCTFSLKNQRDGQVTYETGFDILSVSPDGSFGSSLEANAPPQAGAIGINGNMLIVNLSFDPSQPSHREIMIGVRCSECSDLAQSTRYALMVTKNGTGDGLVTSDVPGINCGSDCSETYDKGTTITFTASADAGSTFIGWSGGGCSGTGPCTISLSSDTTIGASFVLLGNCAYTISPANKTFNAKGGTVSINVGATGQANCPAPLVVKDAEWISVSGTPTWKANKGTVKITVQKNPGSHSRTGVVSIGGENLTIEEDGAICQLTALKPSSNKYPNTGGSGSFDITVSPEDCGWNVATTFEWIHLDTTTGTGNGTAAFHLDANGTGKNRTGKIDVSLAQNVTKKKTFSINENK